MQNAVMSQFVWRSNIIWRQGLIAGQAHLLLAGMAIRSWILGLWRRFAFDVASAKLSDIQIVCVALPSRSKGNNNTLPIVFSTIASMSNREEEGWSSYASRSTVALSIDTGGAVLKNTRCTCILSGPSKYYHIVSILGALRWSWHEQSTTGCGMLQDKAGSESCD